MSLMPPTEPLRSAVVSEAWDAAFGLLEQYDAELRATFESPERRPSPAEAAQLLAANEALVAELAAARDEVARSLRQFQRERRGVHAYLGSGA